MKTTTYTCDQCRRVTDGGPDDVLELNPVHIPSPSPGLEYPIQRHPMIRDTMHFCSVQCLRLWASDEEPPSRPDEHWE